ncbi:MAG: carboxypeptidase-like regulatory domain-containing protein [Cyanobacteria bacterium J06649_4]
MTPRLFILSLGTAIGITISGSAQMARAHGANIEVNPASVEIKATFDTGEPMAEAQVLIYSPSTLSTPWSSGETDNTGRFVFTPDAAEPGTWEVTVRKAGHGHTTAFEIGEDASASSPSSTAPTAQRWISMAAIVWGFVGTALFFSSRTSSKRASTSSDKASRTTPDTNEITTMANAVQEGKR